MTLMLSDLECLLIARSLHTRDIPTIAHSILRIERLLHHLKLLLGASDYESLSPPSPATVIRPLAVEYQQVEESFHSAYSLQNQGDSERNEAVDLTIKSISQFPPQQTRESEKEEISRTEVPLSPPYKCDELVALDLTTAKRTHALLHATSNRNSTHNRDSVGSQFSSEDFTSTVDKTKITKARRRMKRLNNNHQGYIFPSKRPIKCDTCGKVIRADNFQVHQRSHTGEKPYKCPKCPFRSANPSSMPKHLRLHDKPREIYTCLKCSYSTIYKSNLSAHKKKHHPNHPSSKTSNAPTDSMRYNSDIQEPPNHSTDFHPQRNATSATDNNNDTNNNLSSISGSTYKTS